VEAPAAPTFREALRFWWRLGWISFGGPAGQIAVMHEELVVRRRWISEGRFLHALNYCMALPGPEAQQLATYVGWLLHGTRGGIAAGALFVLPSVAILGVLSWLYMAAGSLPVVEGVLAGFKPAVVAVILAAGWRLGRRAVRGWFHAALAAAALAAIHFGAPFPAVIGGAALLGVLAHRAVPGAAAAGDGPPPAPRGVAGSVLDEDTPPPPHAVPSPGRTARVAAAGLLLWGAGLGLACLAGGPAGPLVTMGLFFTAAAFVTFGGAYAVLPFVAQMAIETWGWLDRRQMVDGLALGETTPGPLIMVVGFVGFVGAWRSLGPSWGPAGLLVATWFTFLPSFLFIFLGAPHVERLRGRPAWTAPLAAVTAAVVGIILHLAVYLAPPVFLPAGSPDPFALAVATLALAALFLGRWSVHGTVLAAGAAGAAWRLLAS